MVSLISASAVALPANIIAQMQTRELTPADYELLLTLQDAIAEATLYAEPAIESSEECSRSRKFRS